MDEYIEKITNENETAYLKENSGTTDGSILRIKSLEKTYDLRWKCKLQRSTYLKQVRTNLTLDLPLSGRHEETLRALDVGENGELREFESSIMVNSLGVSAIVYYRDEKSGERNIFLKPRKGNRKKTEKNTYKGTGVFQNMLGTVSGVVQMPRGQGIDNLVSYATSEILREFSRETGIEEGENPIQQIVPLAFVRELARGGKPQFFFLIEINQLSNKQFSNMFKKSMEGLEEFEDEIVKNHLLVLVPT